MNLSKQIIAIILLLFLVAFTGVAFAEEPQVVGEAAVLMDARTGQVLYQKNAYKQMYPASTTKMLTAIVALERGELDDVITVSEKASLVEGSAIWLKKDEQMVLEDLLYALMLNSANDAAIAIAQHIAGTVEQFNFILNETAAGLGAKNTHFTNPNGLPDEDHYTTAYDLAVIAKNALKNEKFMEIVGTKTKTIERQDPEDFKYLINHNRLLWLYEDATGIKTGYTTAAQQCIVASAHRDGRELIAVVLKTEGVNIWHDSMALFDYGFDNFQLQQLITKGQIVDKTKVKYSQDEVPLVTTADAYYNFSVDHQLDIKQKVKLNQGLSAPIEKGDILGELIIYDGEKQIKTIKLQAGATIERPLKTFWWFWPLAIIGGLLVLLAILILIFILTYYIRLRAKRIVIKRRRRK
ncbi:D-alanyl-D-alanine carboxypeptidase family protein [Peptococcaceae bacterium 1198_IL3148]